MTMIDDGIKQTGRDESMHVRDIAEVVLESLVAPPATDSTDAI